MKAYIDRPGEFLSPFWADALPRVGDTIKLYNENDPNEARVVKWVEHRFFEGTEGYQDQQIIIRVGDNMRQEAMVV